MKKVLFIEARNTGRSQMAEAFFNQIAKGEGKARSAGIHPVKRLDDNVIEIMWESGIEISRQHLKPLTPKLINWAERVITMSCEAEVSWPPTISETEDWPIEDPEGKLPGQVRKIRDEIKARVSGLVRDIAKEHY